jgi:hypothetical protein
MPRAPSLDYFAKSIVCKVTTRRSGEGQHLGGPHPDRGASGLEPHPVPAAPLEQHPVPAAPLEPHPVRQALLELIRRDRVVTATDAARELGGSTGLYSFHLRQLARYGVIEEAPARRGRVRPWRLAEPGAAGSPEQPGSRPASDAELSAVARGLEDESYRRWLERRDTVPEPWRRDEAFSQVVYLTPDEMAGMAEVIRALIAQYQHREAKPTARPPEAAPVAVVARLFPLLEPGAAPAPGLGNR